MYRISYSQLMGEQKAILTLKLDTEEPVELRDFVGAFTSLANEFERFIDAEFPDAHSDPKMFVREVRRGSIEADILTGLTIAVAHLDQVMVLEDFIRRWGERFKALVSGNYAPGQLETTSELKDWADTVRSIAADPIASHRLQVAKFEDGNREIKASFSFTTPEARTALQNIEDRRQALTKPDHNAHERALMVFTRSDINDADVGKSSGERVRIEEISEKSLPLMYGSEIAEARIKHEIREADENVYKKGFVVDVVVKLRNGKPVAYSVTNVHEVLDLPD
ncbi:hypothetical protein QTA58_22610 [Neorhizobium sp. CSC1952]|uniref:hypothetical protein n=1 Tax=Neorhizobium sp. CSC1952 TaxID=2978974 RepID=UPI0025A4EA1E|nr:hypothetical protein [Rhizobium sp. CSC1952]WJR66947.1 hypothetical protein QTA58_22610 [Rhizobium sp. CSC1952]